MKTLDFSETIAASDHKQMDLMKTCEYRRSRSFIDLGPRSRTYKNSKTDFLKNYYVDLNQTLYGSFQVQGNENLMT